MLQELIVKNLALIEEARVDFANNLNILTGETGAGKSILMGSINLCLGKRASKDIIKDDSKETTVELVFSGDADNIIIKRGIGKDKSYAKVNGENVTLAELKNITSRLVDLYGQHDSEELRDNSKHINYIDSFGHIELERLKNDVYEKYHEYKKAKEKLSQFTLDDNLRSREIDLLKYEINEIESANLKENEEDELTETYKKISNSKKILTNLFNAKEILENSNLSSVAMEVKKANKYDADLENLSQMATDAENIYTDILREIDLVVSKYDLDEEELYKIEQRLDLIRSINNKYGGTVSKTLLLLEEKNKKLEELENYDTEKYKAVENYTALESKLMNCADLLSNKRKQIALDFENKLINEMQDLGFNEVKFKIQFNKKNEISSNGYDEAVFLISLNVGESLKPLTDIASGGELSRIMLAIKVILSDNDNTNTLIFDEIDQGISGITAAKVAKKLEKISINRQVICITHLPQIACKADAHFEIIKKVIDGKTYTNINKLDEENSIRELARLLSGGEITEKAIENARDLKK